MRPTMLLSKTLFAFYLISVMAVSVAHAKVYSGSCGAEGHDLKWEFNTEDSVLVVSGTGSVMVDVVGWPGIYKKPWEDLTYFIARVELPSTIKHVGMNLFSDCNELREINLPEGLESIGDNAFTNDRALKSITLPQSLKSIGGFAFYGCGLTTIDIPNRVDSIGSWAFSGTKLETVRLPSGLTTISNGLFAFCFALKEVQLPSALERIDDCAFERCPLTDITFPSTLTSIGEQAFIRCEKLTSIDLPSSLTSIGDEAFGFCTALKSIRCLSSTPPDIKNTTYAQWNMADNIVDWKLLRDVLLTVPDETLDAYLSAKGWMEFSRINGRSPQKETQHGNKLLSRDAIINSESHVPDISIALEDDYLHITGALSYFGLMSAYVFYELDDDALIIRGINVPYLDVAKFGYDNYTIDFKIGPIDHPIERLNVSVTGSYRTEKTFTVDFTNIADVPLDSPVADAPIFDLLGRPVTHPTHGIYIQNGRKVMIK